MIQSFFVYYLGSELSIILTFCAIIRIYLYLIDRQFEKKEKDYERGK